MNISINNLVNFILEKYNLNNGKNTKLYRTQLLEVLNGKYDEMPSYIKDSKKVTGNYLRKQNGVYKTYDTLHFEITIDLKDENDNLVRKINIQAEILDYIKKTLSQTIFLYKALLEGEILTTLILPPIQQQNLPVDPKVLFTTNRRNAHIFALPYPKEFFQILDGFIDYAEGVDSTFIKEVTEILKNKANTDDIVFYEILRVLDTIKTHIQMQQYDLNFSIACTLFYTNLCEFIKDKNFTIEQLQLLEDMIQFTQSIIKSNQKMKYSNFERDMRYIESKEFIKQVLFLMKNSNVSFKYGEEDKFIAFIKKKKLKYKIDFNNEKIIGQLKITFKTILNIQDAIDLLLHDKDSREEITLYLLDIDISNCTYLEWINNIKDAFNKYLKITNGCLLDYIGCLDEKEPAIEVIQKILHYVFDEQLKEQLHIIQEQQKETIDETQKNHNEKMLKVYDKILKILYNGFYREIEDDFESDLLNLIATYLDMSEIASVASTKLKKNDTDIEKFTDAIKKYIIKAFKDNKETIEQHYEFLEGQKIKFEQITEKIFVQIVNKYERLFLNDNIITDYIQELIEIEKETISNPQNLNPAKLKALLNAIVTYIKNNNNYNVFYKSLLQYVNVILQHISKNIEENVKKAKNENNEDLVEEIYIVKRELMFDKDLAKIIQEINKLFNFENSYIILSKLNAIKLELQFKSTILQTLQISDEGKISVLPSYLNSRTYSATNLSNDSINYLAILYKLLGDKTLVDYYEQQPDLIINFAKALFKIPNIRLLCLLPCTNIVYCIGPRTVDGTVTLCLKIDNNALIELIALNNGNNEFIVVSLKAVDSVCDFDISANGGKIHDNCMLLELTPLAGSPGSKLQQILDNPQFVANIQASNTTTNRKI